MQGDMSEALVSRFITDVFEQGRTDVVDQLVTPDFVSHPLPGAGPDVMKQAISRVSTGLSDARFDIQDVVAEGDRVAVRLTSTATQVGEFMGMPPTGRSLHHRGDPHLPHLRRPHRRALAPGRHAGHAAAARPHARTGQSGVAGRPTNRLRDVQGTPGVPGGTQGAETAQGPTYASIS